MPTPLAHSTKFGLMVLLAFAPLALGGCVYRMNIQQGNYLEEKTVNQLQVGMTRSQVRYLLGTPMIPATFDHDRWDYLYYFKRGRLEQPEQRRLTVYFENDKVVRVERHGSASDPRPTEPPVVDPGGAPEPATVKPTGIEGTSVAGSAP